jgi:hypothetical protein
VSAARAVAAHRRHSPARNEEDVRKAEGVTRLSHAQSARRLTRRRRRRHAGAGQSRAAQRHCADGRQHIYGQLHLFSLAVGDGDGDAGPQQQPIRFRFRFHRFVARGVAPTLTLHRLSVTHSTLPSAACSAPIGLRLRHRLSAAAAPTPQAQCKQTRLCLCLCLFALRLTTASAPEVSYCCVVLCYFVLWVYEC